MATVQQYWAFVDRWTSLSNVKTVGIGKRDGVPYYISDPSGKSPEQIDAMIQELRDALDLSPDD